MSKGDQFIGERSLNPNLYSLESKIIKIVVRSDRLGAGLMDEWIQHAIKSEHRGFLVQ